MADPVSARLALAQGEGLALPPGRLAALRPRAGADLRVLPGEVHVIQGFKPDHDAFAARGFETGVAPEGRYAAALVCLPRAKGEARALVARAAGLVPEGAPIVVDGAKTDGADSLLRECRRALGAAGGEVAGVVSKAHGKAFWFASPGADAFAGWDEAPEAPHATAHAAFSAGAVDRGSRLLAEALPARLPGRVADLGAGWGHLAAAALAREGVEECHLIEAEWDALQAARANVADPRARFHWADATAFAPEAPFDVVIANPPFHRGRAADPEIGRAFLRAAARMLTPRGTLWCVANRHLPYERTLSEVFAETREVAAGPTGAGGRSADPGPAAAGGPSADSDPAAAGDPAVAGRPAAAGDPAYKVLTATRPLDASPAAARGRRRRRVA